MRDKRKCWVKESVKITKVCLSARDATKLNECDGKFTSIVSTACYTELKPDTEYINRQPWNLKKVPHLKPTGGCGLRKLHPHIYSSIKLISVLP